MVYSIVFQQEKEAIDRFTKIPEKDDNIKEQDHIRIISIPDKDRISIGAGTEQNQNKTIFQNDATITGSRASKALATELTSILGG